VRFPYIHSETDARRALDHFPQRLIFFGHTHLSQVHRLDPDGRIEFRRAPGFELAPSSRYLINVGMAAQAVLLFDSAAQRIHYNTFT
jgi:hypothetical protein